MGGVRSKNPSASSVLQPDRHSQTGLFAAISGAGVHAHPILLPFMALDYQAWICVLGKVLPAYQLVASDSDSDPDVLPLWIACQILGHRDA